jgi:hypothetical protein
VREHAEQQILSHINNNTLTGNDSIDLLLRFGAKNKWSLEAIIDKYIELRPDLLNRLDVC